MFLTLKNIKNMEQKRRKTVTDKPKDKKASMNAFYESNKGEENFTEFPDKVIKNSPDFFRSISNEFETKQEISAAFFCSLVLTSGMFPNYRTIYDGKKYESNLFGYLYGPFGSGKGVLNTCSELLMPVHKEKIERSKHYREWYKTLGEDTIKKYKLTAPKDELLIIPGNNTKSNLYKLFAENNGRAVMKESETDTLSTANRGENGGFSDFLRSVYEHETVSKSTKSEGTLFIPFPCLTLLLSSTPNQILSLIRDIEDGLYSRFMYLKIIPDNLFKKVFDTSGVNPYEMMAVRGELLNWLYYELPADPEQSIMFRFTKEQEAKFYTFFDQMKVEYRKIYGTHMYGVVHRLGLIFTRISMTLSMVRIFDIKHQLVELPNEIVCNEMDFESTKLIISTLSENNHEVYALLMKGKADRENTPGNFTLEDKLQKIKKCIELDRNGFSQRQIAKAVLGDSALSGTVNRWLKKNRSNG